MTELLAAGFTDTFRHFNPTLEGVYSWWSYRFHASEKNAGWRIDYFLVSNRFARGEGRAHPDRRVRFGSLSGADRN